MGPLSAKQHREHLKFLAQEQRENTKMEREEARKNQLHEIKLQESALKANQGIGHKEQLHEAKLKDLGSSLSKPPKINKQKLGIPTTNPMAGTGMFKQGQHHLTMGTDTVPAMLTPGEAVIPAPAAQDPKNKKAIKRMVQEGRKANRKKLRDGTVNIVKTDSPQPIPTMGTHGGVPQQVQQAVGYSEGVAEVPSLAYYHYDEPGSSYMNGTMGVKQYADGIPEVPDTLNSDNWDTQAIYDFSQDIPQPMSGVEVAENNRLVKPVYDFSTVDPNTLLPKAEDKSYDNAEAARLGNYPVAAPVQTVVPTKAKAPVTAPVAVPAMPDQTEAETKRLTAAAEEAWANAPAVEPGQDATEQEGSAAKVVPVAPGDMAGASTALQSRVKSIDEYMKMQGYDDSKPKDEKGFIESFKNAFTYSGAKELLGLNNQEVARLAVMTLGGRLRGYNLGHSLAFAGRQAFAESSKRQAQEDSDRKAAMRNAVTMRQQDIRQEIADKRAEAKELHDRFVAENQRKIAEAKEQYLRDRDDRKFAQQMAILQQTQAAQNARMMAQFGNQWQMMIAREEYRENNPQKQAERYQKLVGSTSDTINNILNTQFGSDTRKVSAARQALPTAGEMTNQAYGYFKRSGYNVNDIDSTMAMNSIMAMAARDMATDAAGGKLSKGTADITPYVAKYVIQFRTGLDSSLFKVGDNKDMNPEKIVNLEQQAIINSSNPEAARAKLSALATDWKANGAKYRKEYSGSNNESAFYQWANSQLEKQKKKESK